MSYSDVKTWIDDWALPVGGDTARGRPSTLRHTKGASRANLPKTRGWWVDLRGVSAAEIGSLQGRYRQSVDVDLLVHYPHDTEPELLQAAIISDYEAIVGYLGNPANWGSPTSTVVSIGAKQIPRFPAAFEVVDRSTLLVIQITIQHEVTV